MDKQDWPKFRELMKSVAQVTNTYGKDIELATTVMFAALGQYPLHAVSEAVMNCCVRGNGDFPTLAGIFKGIEGDIDERAALAWAEVDAAAQKTGGERSVRFADPVIHWVIPKMRGWESVARGIVNGDGWLKKDFTTLYQAGVKQHITWADVPAVLEGVFTLKVYDTAAGKCFPVRELPALGATA